MIENIAQHGYALLFAGTLVEGEAALLLATLAAQQGLLDIRVVLLVAWVGACIIDQALFQAFRLLGPRLFEKWPALESKTARARRWMVTNPIKFILMFRFLWGIRVACLAAVAMSGVPTRVFLPLSIIACALWAGVVGLFGYLFSRSVMTVLGSMESVQHVAMGVIAVIALLAAGGLFTRWIARRLGIVPQN